jgi:diguanylate cyclase (GGDEF)-like protein
MSNQILVVSDNQAFIALCHKTSPDFDIIYFNTAEEALTALTLPDQYSALLADSKLPDMEIDIFFEQIIGNFSVIPLLTTRDTELTTALDIVNRLNIFRLLPQPCSLEQLETVLYDASCQSMLINRERDLRKKIQRLTDIDALTGCYKRSVLQKRLPIELKRSTRYSHFLSLILCDIDQLEKINRDHGHRIGDRILTGVAQAGREIFRMDIDWISRWGEDEFLIILPETPIRGAAVVAERLRQAVDELAIESKNTFARATISIGLTGFAPETPNWNHTTDDILRVADNCLQQAKCDGGNKVLICP